MVRVATVCFCGFERGVLCRESASGVADRFASGLLISAMILKSEDMIGTAASVTETGIVEQTTPGVASEDSGG